MLQQPTKEKLHALRLHGRIEALERQEQDEAARELSFLDRLALLIDQQWNWRENQALTRRVKASRLRGAACVENIDYRTERGLNRSVIRALAQESCWVKNHEHIFVLGPTGVGKSYVASALAQKACRDGYSVHYTRATGLFRDLNLARGDGTDGGIGAAGLLGNRGRSLPDSLDDPDLATASVPLARADRGSHAGRRHPRPAGSQCSSHRDARRIDAQTTRG